VSKTQYRVSSLCCQLFLAVILTLFVSPSKAQNNLVKPVRVNNQTLLNYAPANSLVEQEEADIRIDPTKPPGFSENKLSFFEHLKIRLAVAGTIFISFAVIRYSLGKIKEYMHK